eukprot:8990-Rhodomonas_salina.1
MAYCARVYRATIVLRGVRSNKDDTPVEEWLEKELAKVLRYPLLYTPTARAVPLGHATLPPTVCTTRICSAAPFCMLLRLEQYHSDTVRGCFVPRVGRWYCSGTDGAHCSVLLLAIRILP